MMEDIAAILKEGMGTPYLAIFDGGDKPIIDPVSGLPIGMFLDNFIYEYNEDKEDSGSFVLTTDNPNIADLPQLAYEMPLHLQWGWILSDGTSICSPVRKVIITGNNNSFTSEGITLEIKFADASILLKNQPSKYYSQENSFYSDLAKLCEGVPVGVTLLDYNTVEVTEKVVLKNTEVQPVIEEFIQEPIPDDMGPSFYEHVLSIDKDSSDKPRRFVTLYESTE